MVGSQGGTLAAAVPLFQALGTSILESQRCDTGFQRLLRVLSVAVAAQDDCRLRDLDDDDVSSAVGRLLRATNPPPELRVVVSEPGTPDARAAMRLSARRWQNREPTLQYEAEALAQNFNTASTAFDVINAAARGTLAGGPLPMGNEQSYALAMHSATQRVRRL